jgi:DNA mismatch repair protein MutS
LNIPASAAQISPIDTIFTHFPAIETWLHGRLEEEAERLREMFERSTPYSLVLLNESLASTTPTEGLFLARDVLAGLRTIGVRGIYATHLVELCSWIGEIEGAVSGDSKLINLVAGVRFTPDGHPEPTFQIMPGTPAGSGYAQEIARRHGISLEQILELRRNNNHKSK